MKIFISLVAACLLSTGAFAADKSAPVFQLRLAADKPGPDAVPMELVSKNGDRTVTNLLLIKKTVLMDQSALKSARTGTDNLGHPVIEILFSKTGTDQFAKVTQQNIGHRLGIIVDGKLFSAPLIMAAMTDGKAVISGSFTKEEAVALVKKINASITK